MEGFASKERPEDRQTGRQATVTKMKKQLNSGNGVGRRVANILPLHKIILNSRNELHCFFSGNYRAWEENVKRGPNII